MLSEIDIEDFIILMHSGEKVIEMKIWGKRVENGIELLFQFWVIFLYDKNSNNGGF